MIRAQPLVAAAALTVSAILVKRTADARRARRLATGLVVVALLLLGVVDVVLHRVADVQVLHAFGLRFELFAVDWQATAPFVDVLVALVAVTLAPVTTHGPRTLAAILAIIALALAILAITNPVGLAVLWTLQVTVAVGALRRSTGAVEAARVFARYQSIGLVAIGGALLAGHLGWTTTTAALWLLAVGVREAMLPMHGWLPKLTSAAPLGLVVALVAPQPGVYAQLVVCSELTGGQLAHGFAVIGALTAIGGATLAVVQTDARRAAAWLVISQSGLIAFGLENVSTVGRAGAELTWQVMALAMSGFVMTIAALEARRGPLSLQRHTGNFARTPRMAVAFLLLGLASVALPLTLGFIAEDLLVQGSVAEYPLVGCSVIVATALNGCTVMRCFFALFSGTNRHHGERDLTPREVAAVTILLGVLFIGGLVPGWFVGSPDEVLVQQGR